MRPNKCCERDYAYCSSSDREKIKIIRLQLLASKIKFQVILLRKANWNSVVSPIDPSQRHIAISNKWRYIEQEKRIIFQRLLPDWFFCLSEFCPLCVKYVIKCRLFTGEWRAMERSIIWQNGICWVEYSSGAWKIAQCSCSAMIGYVLNGLWTLFSWYVMLCKLFDV